MYATALVGALVMLVGPGKADKTERTEFPIVIKAAQGIPDTAMQSLRRSLTGTKAFRIEAKQVPGAVQLAIDTFEPVEGRHADKLEGSAEWNGRTIPFAIMWTSGKRESSCDEFAARLLEELRNLDAGRPSHALPVSQSRDRSPQH